jgi:hypothetical protein
MTFQVIVLLGSQATEPSTLTVVSLASKDALSTSLPEQDDNPSRLVNKYLDSVADHEIRHRPSSNLPFHLIVFSLPKVFDWWKPVMTRGTYTSCSNGSVSASCRRGSAAFSYKAFIPP